MYEFTLFPLYSLRVSREKGLRLILCPGLLENSWEGRDDVKKVGQEYLTLKVAPT